MDETIGLYLLDNPLRGGCRETYCMLSMVWMCFFHFYGWILFIRVIDYQRDEWHYIILSKVTVYSGIPRKYLISKWLGYHSQSLRWVFVTLESELVEVIPRALANLTLAQQQYKQVLHIIVLNCHTFWCNLCVLYCWNKSSVAISNWSRLAPLLLNLLW